MLKINVKSIQEGIKELSKFKSKESFINLVNDEDDVYLTKVCVNDLHEIIFYKLDAHSEGTNNYQLSETIIKAITKIKEDSIDIRPLSEGHIQLISSKRTIDFCIEDYEFNYNLLNFGPNEKFSVPGAEMKVLLQTTDYAAKDETRPILQGINFNENRVCGLDGYRLAVRECSTMNLEGSYTIHADILKALGSLIKKDSNIYISFNNMTCRIELDNLTVCSNLLEGSYIKYESLLPDESKINATLDKEELKEEVEFLLSLAEDKNNPIMKFNISSEKVNISSPGAFASSIIDLEKTSSDGEIEIAVNTNYIYDMLKHFNDKINLKFTMNLQPMVCKCSEFKGLDMVLPIRLFK